jgi:hexokinase
LALDLGGTNFRVLSVEFESGQMTDVQVEHYHISEELRLGPGRELFDYLAECMYDFLQSKGLKGQSIPLGIHAKFI